MCLGQVWVQFSDLHARSSCICCDTAKVGYLQEEQKVERLRGKLEELGIDVDSLLEGIGGPEDDAEDSGNADLT